MNLHELDVYFRGGRDYIQGSIILSRTFDHLLSRDILSAGRNPVLTSAKFTSISHTGIAYSETKEKHAIGSISFKDDDNGVTVYIYKTENMPVRIDEKPSLVTGSDFTARLEGKVQFTSAANFDQIIDAVRQLFDDASGRFERATFEMIVASDLPEGCDLREDVAIGRIVHLKNLYLGAKSQRKFRGMLTSHR